MIKPKITKLGFLLLILFFSCQILVCQYGEQPYNIGYKSIVYKDFSRADISLVKELLSSDSINNCRIITTSMWYPAHIKDSDRKTNIAEFLSTTELNEKNDYSPKDSVINPFNKFADYYNIGKAHLSQLKNYSTESFFNPDHLPGKLPLIIYIPGMNGFSFENHILCEEIAKQGNVVISLNSKGSDNRWMKPNTFDYENQIRDILFIIAETYGLPFVDNTKICLIGHSIGGYINILTKIRDNRITSLVSLDGSIIHDLKRSNEFVYKDLSKVNCQILSISTQGFNEARIYLDSMKHADRYYFQTSNFNHKDFKSITYLLRTSIDSVKFRQYQELNNLIVSFISKVNNYNSQNQFNKISNKLSNSGFVATSYLPSIPSFSDFRLKVYNANFNNIAGIYKNTVNQYPSFVISKDELYDWGNNLRFIGYFSQANQVYKLLIELYPDYISGYKGLARTLLLQDKNDEAMKVYESALAKHPNNEWIKRHLDKLKEN